jgi:hypothetical protein
MNHPASCFKKGDCGRQLERSVEAVFSLMGGSKLVKMPLSMYKIMVNINIFDE